MSVPGKCPVCNQDVRRGLFRTYCDFCNCELKEDKKTRGVQAAGYAIAGLAIIVMGRLQTEKLRAAEVKDSWEL